MKAIFVLLFMVTLASGCSMQNYEIVHDVKFCKDMGFGVRYLRNSDGSTRKVECTDKQDESK